MYELDLGSGLVIKRRADETRQDKTRRKKREEDQDVGGVEWGSWWEPAGARWVDKRSQTYQRGVSLDPSQPPLGRAILKSANASIGLASSTS